MCYIHKWWAKRLGSAFHGILLGCLIRPEDDFCRSFYDDKTYTGYTVLDPFMGNGTTVMESYKLGCTALGMDINPVACESVRVAMSPPHKDDLQKAFEQIYESAGKKIRKLYRVDGHDVLYYFWVKQVTCPSCGLLTDLFSSYVFGKNVRPDKHEVRVVCPKCGNVSTEQKQNGIVRCGRCSHSFNQYTGSARGTTAQCLHCSAEFPIIDAVRASGVRPKHRLYAKLVLNPDGTKQYMEATERDRAEYAKCSEILGKAVASKTVKLPIARLDDGRNTVQSINYNYHEWRDFFNDRQLLALGWLHDAILHIDDRINRDALLLLFSGVLEFNNMFASYKGEGTGAVRHMFAHHILKPERMPVEANVWGTKKSSGSFMTLFRSRLLRAVDYRNAPFEMAHGMGKKTVRCGRPFGVAASTGFPLDTGTIPAGTYITCGDACKTGLASRSVDYIVTDPPFFDNVYYSELADFFYSWQSLCPRGFIDNRRTTRSPGEVQDPSPERFSQKLTDVFIECNRVLKDNGLMAFTYHHSRPEGWRSVYRAVHNAGFVMVNAHPIKSEMSVGVPKLQAKSPIQLDVVFVCRKDDGLQYGVTGAAAIDGALAKATYKANRLRAVGLDLSANDMMAIAYSQVMVTLRYPVPDATFDECIANLRAVPAS